MNVETQVSIGQVKRDISDLVNRVAYRGERIVLTSRGKPKAVLVSLEDYEQFKQGEASQKMERWQSWLVESNKLNAEILVRRNQEFFEVEALWQAARADLEARDEQIPGR